MRSPRHYLDLQFECFLLDDDDDDDDDDVENTPFVSFKFEISFTTICTKCAIKVETEVACVNNPCHFSLFLHSKQCMIKERCMAIRVPSNLSTTVGEYSVTVTACCMSSNRISL